jgi:hypothetical protein
VKVSRDSALGRMVVVTQDDLQVKHQLAVKQAMFEAAIAQRNEALDALTAIQTLCQASTATHQSVLVVYVADVLRIVEQAPFIGLTTPEMTA